MMYRIACALPQDLAKDGRGWGYSVQGPTRSDRSGKNVHLVLMIQQTRSTHAVGIWSGAVIVDAK